MKGLRRVGMFFAHAIAGTGRVLFLLALLLGLIIWGLGTRGVPLTVDVAQKIMGGELTVEHAEGGLFGPITLDGLVLDGKSSRIEIDHIVLAWSPRALWRRTVQIDSLVVGSVLIQQKPHVSKPDEPLNPRLPRDVDLRQLQLAHFEQRPVEGAPLIIENIKAQATWQQDVVTLTHLELTHAEAGLVQGMAVVQLAPKSITVRQLEVSGPATLKASGVLGLMGEPSQLVATLAEARWPLQGDAQLRVPEMTATASGVLTGAPMDAAITLKGALRTAVEDKALGFDIDSALQLKAGSAHIERLQVQSTDGAGSLSAEGDAQWQPALKVDAVIDVQKLNPGVLLPEWKGNLNGRFEAATSMQGDVPQVRFTAAIKNSTLRGYPLQLDARGLAALQGETRQLQIDALKLVSGSTRLTAQGKVLPTLDAQLALDARDLNSLLPTLAGSVQLDAKAQGEPSLPSVQAKGSVRGLRYDTVSVGGGMLDIAYAPQAESRAVISASALQVGTTQISSVNLDAAGRVERHTATLRVSLPQPKTEAGVTLAGAADLKNKTWQGNLQQSSFTPPYGPAWTQDAPAALTLAAASQRLEATCWKAGGARLCLDATVAMPSVRVAYRVEQLDTAAFAALLPKDWQLQTVLNGHGVVALDGAVPTTLDLDLNIGAGRIVIPGAPPLQLLPSSLTVQQPGDNWLAKAKLVLDRGQLELEANLPVQGATLLERPLSGRAKVSLPNLAWLTPLIPGVQDLKGALGGAFTLGGSVGAPQLNGALNLTDGSVRIPAAGIVLKDIRGEVRGGASNGVPGALSINASATSGGTVQLAGTVDFADGKPIVQLKISGQDVQVADIADARVWVSPDLLYAQNAEGMKLTGTVTIPKADITPRKLAANAVGASSDQVLVGVAAPPVAKTLPLDAEVTVVLGDAVSFEGFGLKSKVRGRVTAIDKPGSGGTRGRGELELFEAAYKAYGQEIQVETGRILFNGGPISEPTVDIVARRTPREDVTVSLHVRGTLDQPTFDLSSSPAMPREQQLGWLLFGRPIDSGNSEFSGAAAALSLGIAGGDALASRIGKVIGLDQVSLGADATSTAWQSSSTIPGQPGADQTRFTVGKYLSPKLFVSYGVGLFDNGNVLRLLYDLGHGFKLRTEAGLETGGDVLYRIQR